MPLILGGFVFEGFQIPESIGLGGTQEKFTHTLLGGVRVVEAMGPSEHDITWTGRFQGANAWPLARSLDSLRIAGQALPLLIDTEFRMVLITEFKPLYERPYQVPYSITCHVISSATIEDDFISLDLSISLDLGVSVSLTATLG